MSGAAPGRACGEGGGRAPCGSEARAADLGRCRACGASQPRPACLGRPRGRPGPGVVPDLESWLFFFFFFSLWPPGSACGGRRQVTDPSGAPSDRPAGLGVDRAVSGGRGGGGFAVFPDLDLGSSRGASPRPELGKTFGPVPSLSSGFCWRGF